MERTEACKKCGFFDFYIKGDFSYCRPCHTEAQKRYLVNKRMGISYEHKKPEPKLLDKLLSQRTNLRCPRNHLYSGDNLRVEYTKTGFHRRCKACERDAKRVTYGLAPDPDPVRLSNLLEE